MKKFYIVFMMLFMSSQARAQEIDLNPALNGCLMGGGSCLTNTGVKFVDTFFSMFLGGYHVNMGAFETYEYRKRSLEEGWHWSESGKKACRTLKEEYYLEKSGFKAIDARPYQPQRSDHLKRYIDVMRYRHNIDNIFKCTDKQKEMYINSKLRALKKEFGKE